MSVTIALSDDVPTGSAFEKFSSAAILVRRLVFFGLSKAIAAFGLGGVYLICAERQKNRYQ